MEENSLSYTLRLAESDATLQVAVMAYAEWQKITLSRAAFATICLTFMEC